MQKYRFARRASTVDDGMPVRSPVPSAVLRVLVLLVLWVMSGCQAYDAALLKLRSDVPVDAATGKCGDGRVDQDELCDTGITPGMQGACPTECHGEDACNPQVPAGSYCQQQCVVVPIVKAWSGDGCCPAGAGAADDSDCGFCGDEIIGPGEHCDPPESCPTRSECTRDLACVFGIYSGDPERCTSECKVGLATDCVNGDQCCPADCTRQNDDDCSASCGDGMVDRGAGETCEAGDPNNPCPTDCDDGIACTDDLMAGSAQNCNVQCANVEIRSPRNGDGCCPLGASAVNDSDCQPVCGNDIVEGSERCDPCPANCNDNDPCTTDGRTGNQCDVVCSHTPITQAVNGDACCPSGANATSDSDCAPRCGNNVKEANEACDGGSLCRSNCTLMFHSSLVHRYSFDGPASSASAVDSVGGSNGLITNDTLDGDGKLTLAGGSPSSSKGFISLPNRLISPLTNVTVEAWVKWAGGVVRQRIFDFGMSSSGEGNTPGYGTSFFFVGPKNSNGNLAAYFNATSTSNDTAANYYIEASGALSSGTTRHVAVTFADPGSGSAKTLKLYLDGALVAGSANDIDAAYGSTNNRLSGIDDLNMWIGRANFDEENFAGVFYEFRIYSQALSASEIQASFVAGPDPAP